MKLVKDTDQIDKKKQEVSDEKAEEAIRTVIKPIPHTTWANWWN